MTTLHTPLPTQRQTLIPYPPGSAEAPRAALAVAPADLAPPRPERAGAVRLSCIVPSWNEADNLQQLLPLLRQTLAGIAEQWEVIVVDDGSTDRTSEMLAAWTSQPGFRALQLSRNFGKEAALTAGLQAAQGDAVVMLDADLQHPPALIATLLRHWRAGADVAYAVRTDRRDEPLLKRWGTRAFYALINAADRFAVPANAGDFRLMDRRVVDALLSLPEKNRFMKGLYAWVGFDTVAVPYVAAARAGGQSRFGLRQLVRLSLDGLTAFTTWPLRAVSLAGFGLAMLAFGYGLYLVANYFMFGHEVSGWTTIVVGLLFFSGVQLISLGIVGEYVGRIFEEVKGRPLFVVRHQAGSGLKVRGT